MMGRSCIGLGLAAVLAAGCGGGSKPGANSVTRTSRNTFQENAPRMLDVLFMVDNSSSVEKEQVNLRANVPRFVDALAALPGGLPDLHLAVVSSDMGVGNSSIPGCNASGGDNGVFHWAVGPSPLNICTATGLAADAHYISTTGGANPQANFTGDLTAVLQCLLPLGSAGCGFEQPLRSVARALGADGFAPPAENQGFLRPEAILGIVLLTNEDDCSAAQDSFYDVTSNTNLASPLGPPGDFRCSEFGHLCDGAKPRRLAPTGQITDTVSYDNCVPAEEQGQLMRVADFAAGVKALKPDPASQIVVASIQGPVTPYQVHWKAPAVTTDGPWPNVTHSCTAPDGAFADPGVRMQAFAEHFGGNGLVYSICEANYGPALNTIANTMGQQFRDKCIAGPITDRDRDPTNGLQPDCAVVDHAPNGSGTGTVDTTLPACSDVGDTPPCWSLRAPTTECPNPNDQLLVTKRDSAATSPNLRISVECSICIPGLPDPDAGCP
jgi:hypothetical protein